MWKGRWLESDWDIDWELRRRGDLSVNWLWDLWMVRAKARQWEPRSQEKLRGCERELLLVCERD